jgi:hypothetical protein
LSFHVERCVQRTYVNVLIAILVASKQAIVKGKKASVGSRRDNPISRRTLYSTLRVISKDGLVKVYLTKVDLQFSMTYVCQLSIEVVLVCLVSIRQGIHQKLFTHGIANSASQWLKCKVLHGLVQSTGIGTTVEGDDGSRVFTVLCAKEETREVSMVCVSSSFASDHSIPMKQLRHTRILLRLEPTTIISYLKDTVDKSNVSSLCRCRGSQVCLGKGKSLNDNIARIRFTKGNRCHQNLKCSSNDGTIVGAGPIVSTLELCIGPSHERTVSMHAAYALTIRVTNIVYSVWAHNVCIGGIGRSAG